MAVLQSFVIAFAFSFLGSIPPGTISLSVLQLGLDKKINIAWRFAFTASIIEYPYGWLAVKFNHYITSSPVILDNFKLLSAVVMIFLGILNLWSSQKPTAFVKRFQDSGFRKGLILGILNPLAIPFWIGITAYLSAQGWIDLSNSKNLHGYLIGVFLGAFTLLMALAYLSKRISTLFQSQPNIKLIPGLTLVLLGAYGLIDYFI
jgi:threonine/homoserine/homoserine lactone efflux protein